MADQPNIVKIITTNDLYEEVIGLRDDLKTFLVDHKDIPEEVKRLRADVDALNALKWKLTGAALAAGPVGATLVKLIGG